MNQLINQDDGALSFKVKKDSMLLLNWKNNMVEVWVDGKREFIINLGDKNE